MPVINIAAITDKKVIHAKEDILIFDYTYTLGGMPLILAGTYFLASVWPQ